MSEIPVHVSAKIVNLGFSLYVKIFHKNLEYLNLLFFFSYLPIDQLI